LKIGSKPYSLGDKTLLVYSRFYLIILLFVFDHNSSANGPNLLKFSHTTVIDKFQASQKFL